MTRRSLIKSLVGLAVAPEIIGEMNLTPVAPAAPVLTSMFQDLQFVIPDYLPKLIEKYGNTNFGETISLMEIDNPTSIKFTSYDQKKETI